MGSTYRASSSKQVALTTVLATTPEVDFAGCSLMEILIPAGFTATITVYSYSEEDDAWYEYATNPSLPASLPGVIPADSLTFLASAKKLKFVTSIDESSRPVTINRKG